MVPRADSRPRLIQNPEQEWQRGARDLPAVLLAKGILNSAGIKCFLTDDNMVGMDWFISNLLGGVKLLVNQEDAQAATAILHEPTETLDVEGAEDDQQPRCPECQSLDVSFEPLNKKVATRARVDWDSDPAP